MLCFLSWSVLYLLIICRPYFKLNLLNICVVSFLIRMIFWSKYSVLSNDTSRYLFDGLIWNMGFTPSLMTPQQWMNVLGLDPMHLPIDHQNVASVYPIVSGLYFATVKVLFNHHMGFCVLNTLCDVLTTILIGKTLKHMNLQLSHALIYVLNPLCIIESAYSGHVDALGVMLLSLFVYVYVHSKATLSGVLLSLVGLVKIWPLMFVIFIKYKSKWTYVVFLMCALLGLWLTFLNLDHMRGVCMYGVHWYFNQFVFHLFNGFLSGHAARVLMVLGLMTALIVLHVQLKNKSSLNRMMQGLVGCGALFLFFNPTLYPWYSMWMVLMMVFYVSWPLLIFSLSLMSSYHVIARYQMDGVWEEHKWISAIPYVLMTIVFLWKKKKHVVQIDKS